NATARNAKVGRNMAGSSCSFPIDAKQTLCRDRAASGRLREASLCQTSPACCRAPQRRRVRTPLRRGRAAQRLNEGPDGDSIMAVAARCGGWLSGLWLVIGIACPVFAEEQDLAARGGQHAL